jgi:hypothetical protein
LEIFSPQNKQNISQTVVACISPVVVAFPLIERYVAAFLIAELRLV